MHKENTSGNVYTWWSKACFKNPNNYNDSGNSRFKYLFWHEKCVVNQMPGAAEKRIKAILWGQKIN